MTRIVYIITSIIFLSTLSSCQKFEVITKEGPIVRVIEGYHPNRDPEKTILGKITRTDTTTGQIISVTKGRCHIGQHRVKCVSRTRNYKNGRWTFGLTREKTVHR